MTVPKQNYWGFRTFLLRWFFTCSLMKIWKPFGTFLRAVSREAFQIIILWFIDKTGDFGSLSELRTEKIAISGLNHNPFVYTFQIEFLQINSGFESKKKIDIY